MSIAKLSDVVVDIQAGVACGQRSNTGVIQLRMNNVSTLGVVDFSSHIRIPSEFIDSDMYLKAGDVVFNNTNSVELVGKTALFEGHEEPVAFSNHFSRLRTDPKKILPSYLSYWLQHLWHSRRFQSICDRWVGQAAVQRSKLEQLEIPLVHPNEQDRIASKLKQQLSVVANARLAAHNQALDVHKLMPLILASAFSEIADAERVRIGDAAPTNSGTTPSRDRQEYWNPPEFPWVKTGEIAFSPITTTEEKVSGKALEECSLPLLPAGTVLVAMYGQGKTRGQSAVLEVPATTNQACFAILPNETFDHEYLQFWLRHSYGDLRALSDSRGGNQSNLNGAILNSFEVPRVSRAKQRAIVKHIKQALQEATSLQSSVESRMNELEKLPSRLLAQAFNDAGA